jgi:hypothetical protein
MAVSKKPKKKMGRPSSFNGALKLRLLELALANKTDEEMAKAACVSIATFTNWKKRYPDFFAALKKCKCVADGLVEATLFNRATGYSHPAVKFFFDAKSGVVIAQDYIEHHPPDVTACIYWLKNRQPKRWRERKEPQVPVILTPQQSPQLDEAIRKINELMGVKAECSSPQNQPLTLEPPPGLLSR